MDKLERMGLKDLRKHIVFEHVWTPLDIRQQYYSNKGSIYGVVTDRFKNLAFKAPKQSTVREPLFRRRLSEPRRRHAHGRAVRPERLQKNRRMGSEAIILTAALLLWFTGFFILGRIRMRGREVPPRRPDASLSVIIPARNEEHNLPALLRSINAQSVRPQEVIVVDDASTDRTAEVACSLGATVISSQPLPGGWLGKTWACQQGANTAHGNTLLFVDADTWFETGGLERILAHYNTGALSVGPYHAVRLPYEQLSVFLQSHHDRRHGAGWFVRTNAAGQPGKLPARRRS